MRHRPRTARPLLLGLAVLLGLIAPATGGSPAAAKTTQATHTTPQLVAVRAASHPGFDRVVLEFSGGLPEVRRAEYVDALHADGSGARLRIAGAAVLQLTVFQAVGHDEQTGRDTSPGRVVTALPNVVELVQSGDFEATVSYGVGLVQRRPFTLFTLGSPSRVVLDVRTDADLAWRAVHLLDVADYAGGREPYTETVLRRVPALTPAGAVLHHLFAGPTAAERAAGLAVVRSGATGFSGLTISDGIARVQLTGGCRSGGSTFTVADLIMPTLEQFDTVDVVKIYDPQGRTARPTGRTDSIPACLEP